MANLTLKDLPGDLHDDLKKAARERGQSLNSYAITVLRESREERHRRRMMRATSAEYERYMKSLPYTVDSTDLIREDRSEGH